MDNQRYLCICLPHLCCLDLCSHWNISVFFSVLCIFFKVPLKGELLSIMDSWILRWSLRNVVFLRFQVGLRQDLSYWMINDIFDSKRTTVNLKLRRGRRVYLIFWWIRESLAFLEDLYSSFYSWQQTKLPSLWDQVMAKTFSSALLFFFFFVVFFSCKLAIERERCCNC